MCVLCNVSSFSRSGRSEREFPRAYLKSVNRNLKTIVIFIVYLPTHTAQHTRTPAGETKDMMMKVYWEIIVNARRGR